MADEGGREYHFVRNLSNPSQGENAYALLYEIADCLRRLLENGQPSRVELDAIPLSEKDLLVLEENLGEGPIQAEILDEEAGIVRVSETAIAGVWWLREMVENERVGREYLEINLIPEVLQVPLELIEDGHDALQARLFQLGLGDRRRKDEDA
jgi:hydrogenase-1 operon protein HyaF